MQTLNHWATVQSSAQDAMMCHRSAGAVVSSLSWIRWSRREGRLHIVTQWLDHHKFVDSLLSHLISGGGGGGGVQCRERDAHQRCGDAHTVAQRQTAVTACLKSKQLLLFAFARNIQKQTNTVSGRLKYKRLLLFATRNTVIQSFCLDQKGSVRHTDSSGLGCASDRMLRPKKTKRQKPGTLLDQCWSSAGDVGLTICQRLFSAKPKGSICLLSK